MKPHRDPTADFRYVPLALMAAYAGISTTTLWRRMCAGDLPAGCTRVIAGRTCYLPAAYFAEAKRLAGVAS